MAKYDASLIRPHSWPSPEQLPDGRWRRVFSVRLREEPDWTTIPEELSALVTEDVVGYMDAEGVLPTLRDDAVISIHLPDPGDKRDVSATITSKLNGWDDLLFPVAWRMFEDINRMLGTIDTIDGYARDAYPPWSLQRFKGKSAETGG